MIQKITNRGAAQPGAASTRSGRGIGAATDIRALFNRKPAGTSTAVCEKAPAKAPLRTAVQGCTAPTSGPEPRPAAPAARTEAVAADSSMPPQFTASSVESTMNQWLMGVLQRQNEQRTLIYNNALEGWKNVNARNRELGLPEIPPPAPPELAQVSPMPEGWWFKTT